MKKILQLFVKNKRDKQFTINQYKYGTIHASSNYSPWLNDTEFQQIYQQIKNNTLVDIYRCYELWELVETAHQTDKTAHLIEIGVWRGGTAGIMGKKLSLLHSSSTFYLADTFTGVAKATDKDTSYFGGEHADTSQDMVINLLKDKYANFKILKGIFPEETSHLIPLHEKFSFCHIDVDVYESAKDIVNWIWNKMIIGGIIIFDDYGFHTCDGITKYVNEQKNKSDRIIVHNLNGHAIMIKIK